MTDTVSEMTAQVKEMTRGKDTNILVHGLPTQVVRMIDFDVTCVTMQEDENLDILIKIMSDIVRTRRGIGREVTLVDIYRLSCTRTEVAGLPPVVVCFEHAYDREAVLNRAHCLDRSGIMVGTDSV